MRGERQGAKGEGGYFSVDFILANSLSLDTKSPSTQLAGSKKKGNRDQIADPSDLFFTSILGSIWAIFSRIYLDVGLVLLTISADVNVYTASVIKAALFKFNLHYLYIQGDTNTIHFR